MSNSKTNHVKAIATRSKDATVEQVEEHLVEWLKTLYPKKAEEFRKGVRLFHGDILDSLEITEVIMYVNMYMSPKDNLTYRKINNFRMDKTDDLARTIIYGYEKK